MEKFNLTFAEAIGLIFKGYKLARKGWHGSNMYVVSDVVVSKNDGSESKVMTLKKDDKTLQHGWLVSQADAFASDWGIVCCEKKVKK